MQNTCKLYLDELSMHIGTSDLIKNSEQVKHCIEAVPYNGSGSAWIHNQARTQGGFGRFGRTALMK